jgi:lipoate-protein ligase A
VTAALNGRNDLTVHGKKISGNAQFSDTRRLLVHGTLLFNSDLEALRQALAAPADHMFSKARKSIRSAVTNITDHLCVPLDMDRFRRRLSGFLSRTYDELHPLQLTGAQWGAVSRLAGEKYRSWRWTYGQSPAFRVERRVRYESGSLVADLVVKSGRLATVRLRGAGVPPPALERIERQLTGAAYKKVDILERLAAVDLPVLGNAVSAEQLANQIGLN